MNNAGCAGSSVTGFSQPWLVVARWKNAGIAGHTSNPCFGQQVNAAMATVALSRVTELSKRPLEIVHEFVAKAPDSSNIRGCYFVFFKFAAQSVHMCIQCR